MGMGEQFSLDIGGKESQNRGEETIAELKVRYKAHVGVSYRGLGKSEREMCEEILAVLKQDREVERRRLAEIDRADDEREKRATYRR